MIYDFSCDYLEGAHPRLIERLAQTNSEELPGYGLDKHSEHAAELIRRRLGEGAKNAHVHFLVGGTQTNATCIDAVLRPYEAVVAVESGHITGHEAGAIEAAGHKIYTLEGHLGKMNAEKLAVLIENLRHDFSAEHLAQPGMVYISQPTEYGTLYSRDELQALSSVAHAFGLPLFIDGARLGYAMRAPHNDVTWEDLAAAADIFYIGGTKVGALCGEAVVIMNDALKPHFRTMIKQHGAMLAKGRLAGIQFEALFEDDLYERLGENATALAHRLAEGFMQAGFALQMPCQTNQLFVRVMPEDVPFLKEIANFALWERINENLNVDEPMEPGIIEVLRFVTSWATSKEKVEGFIKAMTEHYA